MVTLDTGGAHEGSLEKTAPEGLDESETTVALPTFDGFPKESRAWTVTTWVAPEHVPATTVRAGVRNASRDAVPGLIVSVWAAPVRATAATLITGMPAVVSRK